MREYLLAVELEINCIRILSSINADDFRTDSEKLKISKKNMSTLLSEKLSELNGISFHEISQLYFNRHERYINGQWSTSRQDSIDLPVIGDKHKRCQWPLGCDYTNQSDLDHILPVCAMKINVRRLYDPKKNTAILCPIHNRIVKRDSIALGLWLRNFVTFKK